MVRDLGTSSRHTVSDSATDQCPEAEPHIVRSISRPYARQKGCALVIPIQTKITRKHTGKSKSEQQGTAATLAWCLTDVRAQQWGGHRGHSNCICCAARGVCWMDSASVGMRACSDRATRRTIPVARSLAANPDIFRCFKHHALSAQAVESQNALSEF